MEHAKPTGQDRKTAAVARSATGAEGDGFVEIAILALAGLTLSMFMVGQGVFADVLTLLR